MLECFKLSSLYGYRDASTAKNIDNNSLDNVENFVRAKLSTTIKHFGADKAINTVDFFGNTHMLSPHEFTFSDDERHQLKQIVSFINNALSGVNLIEYLNFGKIFTNEIASIDERSKKLRESLYSNILNIYTSVEVDKDILQRVTEETVSIKYKGNDVIGVWQCILCAESKNKKRKDHIIHSKHGLEETPIIGLLPIF